MSSDGRSSDRASSSVHDTPTALVAENGKMVAPQFCDPERICGIADVLQPGDRIYVGERSRPLEVQTVEVEGGPLTGSTDYPYHVVWFFGNGTRYRLRYSHRATNFPHLDTVSDLHLRNKNHPKRQTQWVKNSGAQSDVIDRLWPVMVDEMHDLADWVLSRTFQQPGIDGVPSDE